MKKIILCPNPERDIRFAVSDRVKKMLDEMQVDYDVCEGTEALAGKLADAEMIITFGGDGTILHAARAAASKNVPLLGVNMGNKGFIAELEIDEIDLIKKAVSGEYWLETRMMLDISVSRDSSTIYSDFALNDVVVGGIAKVIDLSVWGDGRRITGFSGDGVVIATPTGSTAYSMAAGGPIVEPDAENIIVTPICPHVLRGRTYVLTASRLVSVDIGQLGSKQAYLSVDGGKSVSLHGGDIICVKQSGFVTKLVRVTYKSFYEKVSGKLGEKK